MNCNNPSQFTIDSPTEMKTQTFQILPILLFATAAWAAPQQYQVVPIVSQTQDGPNPDGSYSFSYQSGDGTSAQAQGYLKNPGTPAEGQAAQGAYSYTAPDGQVISLQYLADDGGFQPAGAHLPTPPPVPAAIQRALDFLATQPQVDYDDQGNPIAQRLG